MHCITAAILIGNAEPTHSTTRTDSESVPQECVLNICSNSRYKLHTTLHQNYFQNTRTFLPFTKNTSGIFVHFDEFGSLRFGAISHPASPPAVNMFNSITRYQCGSESTFVFVFVLMYWIVTEYSKRTKRWETVIAQTDKQPFRFKYKHRLMDARFVFADVGGFETNSKPTSVNDKVFMICNTKRCICFTAISTRCEWFLVETLSDRCQLLKLYERNNIVVYHFCLSQSVEYFGFDPIWDKLI